MAATTPLKKSPYMIEWMVQANPPEESSTVKKMNDRSLLLSLKVVSATILLVCFLSLKESTCETKKNVSLQKLFSFSRISNFRILDIQIS